ncbi:hypothetical protein Tco_0907391 [Tanacetum coccineum]|uniref:Transposase MuDR plant domain-containing protein n=1 Tax=Tanacetum coccineum TaxID=301880 RepID=A0ABQ5CJ38_9ASTR
METDEQFIKIETGLFYMECRGDNFGLRERGAGAWKCEGTRVERRFSSEDECGMVVADEICGWVRGRDYGKRNPPWFSISAGGLPVAKVLDRLGPCSNKVETNLLLFDDQTQTYPNLFTMMIHHGGRFTDPPRRKYVDGEIPLKGLDIRLRYLANDTDIGEMLKYVHQHKIIYVYVEHSKSVFDPEVNVVDLDTQAGPYNILGYQNDEGEDEADDEGQKQNDKGEDKADNEGQNDEAEEEDCGQGKDYEADDGGKSKEDEAYDRGQSEGDDEDEDVEDIVDEEHIVDEVEVNMNGFNFEFEGEFVEPMQPKLNVTEIDLEVLDFDSFESDVYDDKESARRKGLRKLKRQAGNSTLKNSVFVGKEFPNRNVANEMVRAHVLETRINIQIVKNDKIRARVKCFGVVPLAVKMTKEMISNRAKEKDMKLLDQCKKVEGDLKELGKAKNVNVQDKGKGKMVIGEEEVVTDIHKKTKTRPKPDKTEHEIEKSVGNQSRRRMHLSGPT